MAATKIVKPAGFAKPTTPPPAQINTGSGTPTGGYVPITAGTGAMGASRMPTYQTEIAQPDYTTTQFVANSVYQNLMGRDATKQEVDQYHQKFLAYAKANPIYTRNTSYDASGAPVRDIMATKSALSENDFISNIVRQGPEAKEYTAATTYFDAMRSAMGSFRGGY
jgi:hypothetical protein